MILIIDNEGRRLCQDNRWRDFAMFGTYASCVKVYRSLPAASRKAKAIRGQVVQLPESKDDHTWTVEAGGRVIERKSDKPGYETVTHHELTEFLVKTPACEE